MKIATYLQDGKEKIGAVIADNQSLIDLAAAERLLAPPGKTCKTSILQ